MNKKSYAKASSRPLVIFAVLLIVALAALSIYEYMRVDSLTQTSAQAQIQNDDLNAQLKNIQDQYDSIQKQYQSLQSQYQSLESQYKALQDENAQQTSVQTGGKSNKKVAYLTFDDGPTELTPELLDELKDLNVKATFFIAFMREDTPEKRAILKREVADGHTLGIHSWSHDYYDIYANENNFLDDFNKMMDIITESTGVNPKISRFPGGTGNTVSITASHGEVIMPTLLKDVENMGIKPFDWNVGGQDAELPYPTSSQLVQDVLNDCGGQKNLVILLHDTHQFTIDAVPDIVRELRSQGYTFETLTPDSQTVLQPYAKKSSRS